MWRKDVAPFRPNFFVLGTLKIQRCKFLFLHIGGGIQRNLMTMMFCFMLQTVLEGVVASLVMLMLEVIVIVKCFMEAEGCY